MSRAQLEEATAARKAAEQAFRALRNVSTSPRDLAVFEAEKVFWRARRVESQAMNDVQDAEDLAKALAKYPTRQRRQQRKTP